MSHPNRSSYGLKLWLRKSLMLALGGFTFLAPLSAADSLQFFKNYFVTGDYAVAGVGLRGQGVGGFAQGTVNLSSVPAGADVIAAFLYWQTVELTPNPSSINGFFRGKAIVGKPLGDPKNAACWSSGGTTGPAGSSGRVYRADVLRYLPIDSTRNVRVANGAHVVRLPDSGGSGNGNAPFTNGATLVVVYRIVVPGNPSVAPLRSVVIYDGAYTLSKKSENLTQIVGGFYQAAPNARAKLTSIAGNGQPSFRTQMEVQGTKFPSQAFIGAQGSRWDNPTYTFGLESNKSSFEIEAQPDDNQLCLTWGAIVSSMNVTDTDADGLLDVWETKGMHLNTGTATRPATFGGCSDYRNEPCVNLPQMGAVNGQKDVFVEVDWMQGANNSKPGTHSHIPKLDALTQVAAAFKRQNIRLHFDVGSNYQTLATGPDFAIVPAAFAQGGEVIPESSLTCPNAKTPISACTYTTPYPALSFKKGFTSVRDGNFGLRLPSRFSHLRKDLFHYALFAHAFAGPFDPATGRALTTEPRAVSGVADRPGGDLMITLGLWSSNLPENDEVGSVTVQAGTLMHELGHNLGLSHAGALRVPNCMPNYPSVMNYLYQTRGLTPLAGGDKVIDFSGGTLPSLDENALFEPFSITPRYRTRFYGPLSANDPPSAAAALRCDGSPITDGAKMLRLENDFTTFTDWDHNGVLSQGPLRLDVNFSGGLNDGVNGGALFADSNDWRNLNLQQVGGRLNVNGLSTDVGVSDLGVSDLGVSDLGALELGVSDLGVSDLGVSDLGVSDLGALELGDIDYDTAVLSSIDPPPPPSPSCPTCGLRSTNLIDRITLNWSAPDTGSVLSYNIYRSTTGLPGSFTFLKSTPGGAAATTTDDVPNGSSTLFNTTYTYYVTSLVNVRGSIVESLPSNLASGIVKRLFVAGVTVARVYLDPNPTVLYTVTGSDQPAPAGVSCTTTATPASDAGRYAITCTGPATTGNPVNGIVYTPGTLTVTPRPQTINGFAPLAGKTFGNPPFSIGGVTATSNLPVLFTAGGSCGISGALVTLTGAGVCSITANQAGSQNWQPAPSVVQSFTIAKAPASITFPPLANVTFNTVVFTVSATATSGAPVTLTPGGACAATVGGFVLTNVGTCSFTAQAPETANHLAATGTASFLVGQAPQLITFGALSTKTVGDAAFTINASASSGIPVTFSTSSTSCSVAAGVTPGTATVTLVSSGICAITASQPGNSLYLPAIPVVQSFTINAATFSFANFQSTTGLTLNGSNTFTAGPEYALRMTSATSQASSTWFSEPVPVANGFTSTFDFRITAVPNGSQPADGLAFVIQTGEASAVGAGGGGIGYDTIARSLAVEFDTYPNGSDRNDPNSNHVAIQTNGAGANTSTHSTPGTGATLALNNNPGFTIADGVTRSVEVKFVLTGMGVGTLTVKVNGTVVVSATNVNLGTLGLLSGGKARVGFTGSTGANAENTDVLNWSFQSN